MERGWQDHPLLDGDEYSRRDAWEWLIGEAAWQARRARVNGRMVDIKRGQLTHSYRFMAERWKWSLGRVQRFLADLKNESMIDTQTDTGQALITICNYEKYQMRAKKSDTAIGTRTGTAAIQERYKEEEGKEGNIGSEDKSSSPIGARHWLPVSEWEAFKAMRAKIKKPMTEHAEKLALAKLDEFRAKGHDPTKILNQSILNNWQDLYEPKENQNGNAAKNTGATSGAGVQQGQSYPAKPTFTSEGERLAAKYRAEAERELQGTA